jgi:hypothetical protein
MRKRLSTLSLMLAMFFLPFGYDALFKFVMDKTGSYWAADLIFYAISGCFWISYFICEGIPGKMFRRVKHLIKKPRNV